MTEITPEADAIARNYVLETIVKEMLARSPDLEVIERALSARRYLFLKTEDQMPQQAASIRAFAEVTEAIAEEFFRDAREAREHEGFRAAREG